jgi:hypothetical protein
MPPNRFSSPDVWRGCYGGIQLLEPVCLRLVVICKNTKAHRAANVNAGHKIPLAEAHEYASPPKVRSFVVTCDECGKEYSYEVEEVLRLEMDLPPDFKPHPLYE